MCHRTAAEPRNHGYTARRSRRSELSLVAPSGARQPLISADPRAFSLILPSRWVVRPISGRYCVRSVRTLAKLTRFRGAKRGANAGRHWATPGHVQPLSVQLNATSGHTQPHLATSGECLLSSRPQVRILLGAHVKPIFQLLCSPPGSQSGSQSFAPAVEKNVRQLKQACLCSTPSMATTAVTLPVR